MLIAISSDHGGFYLKSHLIQYIKKQTCHQVLDLGPQNLDSVDYPLFANKVALSVLNKQADIGIIICSTGTGVSIAANRHVGIRAVNAVNEFMAQMSREHNHANVLCLGEKLVSYNTAERIVEVFLNTSFSTNDRHNKRVCMLDSSTKNPI